LMQQLEAQILTQELRSVKVVTEHKEFDLASTANVVVRLLELPVQYDDKGYLKKYTAAELKELKGKNPDLPGYAADFSRLQTGQTVQVTLVRAKGKDEPDDKKPQVSTIVIVAEAPQIDRATPKEKKKK